MNRIKSISAAWWLLLLAVLSLLIYESARKITQAEKITLTLEQLASNYLEQKRVFPYFVQLDGRGKAEVWNNNRLLPDTTRTEKRFVQRTPDHWYLVERNGNHFAFDNLLKKEKSYFRSETGSELYDIRLPGAWKSLNSFSLQETASVNLQEVRQGLSAAQILIVFLIALLLSAYLLAKGSDHKNINLRFNFIWLLVVLGTRYLLFKELAFSPLFAMKLFDPAVFASSAWLPSLGDLLLHILSAAAILVGLRPFFNKIRNKVPGIVSVLVVVFAGDMVVDVVPRLVLDSNISFDLLNIFSLDTLSLVALLCAGSMLYLLAMLAFNVLHELNAQKLWIQLLTWVSAFTIFLFFQRFDAGREAASFVGSIGVVSLLAVFGVFAYKMKRMVILNAMVFSALASSLLIHQAQLKHEAEYLKIFASRLTTSNDVESEYLFRSFENKLAEEFLQPADYDLYVQRKEDFENRIRQLYFSGYLDKYEVLIFTFDPEGTNTNRNELYQRGMLNNVYNSETYPSLSNYFYRIKSPSQLSGYIAKFENCDLKGKFGETFIVLQPKFFQRSYYYPPFLSHRESNSPFDINQYAYAVYSAEKLIRQKGDYPYALTFKEKSLTQPGWFKGYHHFISVENPWTVVVISKDYSKISLLLSMLSVMILLYMGLGMLIFAFSLIGRKKSPTKERQSDLLSTRIRIAMVVLAVAGLLLSVVFNINYTTRQNEERERSLLSTKMRDVSLQLQNVVELERKLKDPERVQLLVNELSEAQKSDFNLYDTSGQLLAGSKNQIFDYQYLAPIMHPDALRELRTHNLSQYLQREQIAGYTFVSAYLPFFNTNRKLLAYINVPFFSESSVLRRELSSYITTLINIYVLLILFSFGVASFLSSRITGPLRLLKEKISGISLERQNEPIEWKHADEIGDLVREYNKALEKLGDSARLLAESEREGAWKEMAKQVAHEIKNPLTPMKLNIQHLQRAWKDKHPKLDEMFDKVTRILIEQIDGLSTLATEFSNFAKMPVENMKKCDLTAITVRSIQLFEKTEGMDIRSDLPEHEVHIFADPEQLSRVCTNLIKNAIQAIPAERIGVIVVKLRRNTTQKSWILEVSDNGIGIPEALQSKIFIPNFSTKTSGMGLGLAISKKIIENSKGSIRFTTSGEGTTFFVEIPEYQD